MELLSVQNLHVSVDNKMVLNGISFALNTGTITALMGPNGSGKSSLAATLMGHPKYHITEGSIVYKGQNIINLSPDKRAKLGMFLAMQHPHEIEGIPFKYFLRHAYNALFDGTEKQKNLKEFNVLLEKKLKQLHLDPEFIDRSINVGFSGGEKKRTEILQLSLFHPMLTILDEIDSGLDIDALALTCQNIHTILQEHDDMSLILITHYPKILEYLTPNTVHIMSQGTIVKTGTYELAKEIETYGYRDL